MLFLSLTEHKETEDGGPFWTAIWQLSIGRPVGSGWLCESIPWATCAVQSESGHQGRSCPPEQPGGRTLPARSRDHRYAGSPVDDALVAADQQPLGLSVYEGLCGECPFGASVAEVMGDHLSMRPSPVREHAPMIPVEVEQVVLHMATLLIGWYSYHRCCQSRSSRW